jgi:hypothetical protein
MSAETESVPIGRADKNALPRLNDFLPSIARPVSFGSAGNERFEQSDLGSAHGMHLGNFYQPLAAQMLRHVFACRHVRQIVGEIRAAEYAACGGL